MLSTARPIEQQLAQLRASFTERLPIRLAEIERAWDAVAQDRLTPEASKRFHRLVHSLAGSAASFGHSEVSQSARQLELFVEPLVKDGTLPTADQIAIVAAGVGALRKLMAAPAEISPNLDHPDRRATVSAEPESHPLVFLVSDGNLTDPLAAQIGYFGYTVRAIPGMDDFSRQLQQSLPAAVLIDTDHVQMNSKWFTKILKGDGSPVPIVFISAHGDLASRLSAVHVGADAYFTKPVNLSHLVDKLDQLISHPASDPYRILIVEDDECLAQSYAIHLQNSGMQTRMVGDPKLVIPELRDWKPDLILMDLYMPFCSGLELAAVIRQQEDYVSIPIVYLSAETRLEQQMAALNLGGDDFLTKPIKAHHLVSSVTARAQRGRTLRSLILCDSLTGLLNHTAIKGRLEIEIERAKRKKMTLAYAMLDLDHFKFINDTYGHPTGDGVLKTLARLLQQRLRKTDIIGRYGGEEFAVILPEATAESAQRVLDEIRIGFAKIPQQSGNMQFSATFSGGIAAWPRYGDSKRLNDAADRALYHAKQSGRNTIMVADTP